MQINRTIIALLSGLGVLGASAGAALADDMGRGGPIGGCYVRADAGYGWSARDDATATITPYGYISASGDVQDSSLDGSWFGEVGFGCSLVRQSTVGGSIKDEPVVVTSPTGLRGDITFSFHGERDFDGEPVTPPNMFDPVHAKVRSDALMFNLYYDLPAMQRFTPYVGAGIGVAFVDLRDITFTNGSTVRIADQDETNFAWSLMAGVATDIGRGMKIDVGYRYLNMGDIESNNAAIGYRLKIDDVSEHQVRVGLRIPLGVFSQ